MGLMEWLSFLYSNEVFDRLSLYDTHIIEQTLD